MTLPFNLMPWVDLTCLASTVHPHDIQALSKLANIHQCAAICVWPQHLDWIPASCEMTKATVVNFPDGSASSAVVQNEIDQVLAQFPHTEIDYVFPYLAYWSGAQQPALDACATIAKHCAAHQVKLKVILETGYVQDEKKLFDLALRVLELEVDMLKTSTGKQSIGATPAAVTSLCRAIAHSNSPAGIKVSGGIRSLAQAHAYYDLILSIIDRAPDREWLRFGCSQVLL